MESNVSRRLQECFFEALRLAPTNAIPSGGASYAYRADGQRIEKFEGATFSWPRPRNSSPYDTNFATNRLYSRYSRMGRRDLKTTTTRQARSRR